MSQDPHLPHHVDRNEGVPVIGRDDTNGVNKRWGEIYLPTVVVDVAHVAQRRRP